MFSGRTSRSGHPGTTQFILLDKSAKSFSVLERERDEKNAKAMAKSEEDFENVKTRDKVFMKFCHFLGEMRTFSGSLSQLENEFSYIPNMTNLSSKNYSKFELEAAEERFGMWLKFNESNIGNVKLYIESFDSFKTQLMIDYQNKSIIKNVCVYVQKAKEELKKNNHENAIKYCTKAIEIDDKFSENAYYIRGYSKLALRGSKSTNELITEVTKDLHSARKLFELRIEELFIILNSCQADGTSNLQMQISRKQNLWNIQISTINKAIGYDKESLAMQIKNIETQKEKLNKSLQNFRLKEDLERNLQEIKQIIDNYQDVESEEFSRLCNQRDDLNFKI